MRRLHLCPFLAVLLGLSSCSHDSGSSAARTPVGFTADLTGTWTGTWSNSSGTDGAFVSTFVQNSPTQGGGSPTPVQGNTSLQGSPCDVPLGVQASLNPGGFVSPPSLRGTFSDGSNVIQFSSIVSISYDAMSGTYEVLEGPCTGETGTLTASISLPLTAAAMDEARDDPELITTFSRDAQGRVIKMVRDAQGQIAITPK